MTTAIGSTTGGRPLAKAAGKKRVTIIPATHGKLTDDYRVCEPDATWIIEKWLDRHPRSGSDSTKSVPFPVGGPPQMA